ncbi:MAG: hypothetical protein QG670_2709 [Thermoproteota archaeon]|nr:hypothetical protein [Thermoproteota archaeon]
MILKIDPSLNARFPGLQALIYKLSDVHIQKRSPDLETFKNEVRKNVKEKYDLESLKDLPTFRFYRDFFWRIGVDPTKNRPATEALIRRILGGGTIPTINTLVDAYSLASIETEIALAVFDIKKMKSELIMHPSKVGEKFVGIGMDKPMIFQGGEVVVSDSEKPIAVYPHRDAEDTKVTMATKDIILMVCGVPGINIETLYQASKTAVEYIYKFCDGNTNIQI